MILKASFLFKNDKDSWILKIFNKKVTTNNNWYEFIVFYDESEDFIKLLISRIEQEKIELFVSLVNSSESPNTWQLDLMSLLDNNKLFLVHRYTRIDYDNEYNFSETCEYDFVTISYKRKAKLSQISNPTVILEPEKLWKDSWYEKMNTNNKYI